MSGMFLGFLLQMPTENGVKIMSGKEWGGGIKKAKKIWNVIANKLTNKFDHVGFLVKKT